MSKNKNLLYQLFHRYFIQALNGMALGLFCTLIIGLILKQVGTMLGGNIGLLFNMVAAVTMSITGAVIGIGVSQSLNAPRLVVLASAASGLIGAFGSNLSAYTLLSSSGQLVMSGPGDPLGALIAVIIGCEIGTLVSGKTKIDIIVTPLVTILSASVTAFLVGPHLMNFMHSLGNFILVATELQPFLMGIAVSVIMGIILTLPISSAALAIILGLSGLAAGASTAGCAAQMVGFAVISYKANGLNGLLAQGIGTSMLQVPNIMKKPIIWLPPIIASAITGPIATVLFKMSNNAAGAGMGTSGFVGQLMTWQTMSSSSDSTILLLQILLLHFIFPALISYMVYQFMKKRGWIKDNDYKLDL